VGTKGDKLSARQKAEAVARFDGEPWLAGGGPVLLTSARTKAGIDLLWRDVRAAFSA
jgi:hypothetical protein